jgi:hypothetical protein
MLLSPIPPALIDPRQGGEAGNVPCCFHHDEWRADMSNFLHKLVEELRTREQYLEDHSTHPVFDTDEGDTFRREYDKLKAELDCFNERVQKARDADEDYDEHFEREIKDQHRHLSLKIDTWSKKVQG